MPDRAPLPPLTGYTFEGYRNADGSVGTRNILGIATTVQCVAPTVDYAAYDWCKMKSHRRSIYRFVWRGIPDPFMEALDCPAGDQLTAARNNSVTVQQALAMWNTAFIARHSSRLNVGGSWKSGRVFSIEKIDPRTTTR